MWFIVVIGSFLVPFILGQSCEYVQKVGSTPLTISSPNYPANYKPGANCEWTTTAFADYKLQLTCTDFNVPSTLLGELLDPLTGNLINICGPNYLQISPTGDEYYKDGITYCGRRSFTIASVRNNMTIRFNSQRGSTGGRFSCTLKRMVRPCSCGRHKNSRIYGGQNAVLHDYPMVAGLINTFYKDYFCGATIITPRIALTAKKCFIHPVVEISLLVGDYNLSSENDTNYSKLYPIESTACYPDCTISSNTNNELGLVKTVWEIDLNVGVALACLPSKYQYQSFTGSKVVVEGWGVLEFTEPKADILQKVELDVISQAECSEYYGSAISNNDICTFAPNKGLCDFDTGNGLLYTDNGRVYVIGVASDVYCSRNNNSDVSVRVTSFMKWIKDNSDDFEYCPN